MVVNLSFFLYSLAIISLRVGLSIFLPNFFLMESVAFLMIGFITLNNNGVAAADAVATTAIAAVTLT
ncbi:MAG: hypothetical protein CM15mV34_1840 [Caudoviricetes sp.]|nr:MAG: hypothetical protein CM15mV34_1840 [Caudoviricetes sp.]